MNARDYRKIINSVYFGIKTADTKVDYLQDDINKAFRSIIKYYAVAEVLKYTSEKNATNKEELRFTSWSHSEALIEIFKSIEVELVIRLRTLLAKERYSKRKLKNVRKLAECTDGSQTGGSFIEDLKQYCSLDGRRKRLRVLVINFCEKDYFGKIIENNQKVLFHKDQAPEKRTIRNITREGYKIVTYYRSNASIDRDAIIGAMEDISEIIISFLGNNINRYRIANIDNLYEYVRKLVSALYDEEKSTTIAEKLTKSMKICFRNTLKVIHWQ